MTMIELPRPGSRGGVIVVSGTRGAGKSTLLLQARAAALELGLSVGGIISLARVVDGVKTGIDVMDAASGQIMALAHYRAERESSGPGVQTGHYVFDLDGLAAGRRWAEDGQAAELFFVDELGPLEFVQGQGWAAIIGMIAARAYGCALVTLRPELLERARAALGLGENVPVLAIEAAHRERQAAELRDWLELWARRR